MVVIIRKGAAPMPDGSILRLSGLIEGNDKRSQNSVFEYRGASVYSDAGGTSFSFTLVGFPLLGWSGLTNVEVAIKLIDAWLDRRETLSPVIEVDGVVERQPPSFTA